MGEYNSTLERFRVNQRHVYHRKGKVPLLQSGPIIIGSMDVAALYPSCKSKGTMDTIKESSNMCNMVFENIISIFLCKFVSILTRGKSGDPRLNEFLQVPKPRTTLNSFLRRKSETQFVGPPAKQHVDLEQSQIRKLLGIASARSTNVVMNHHYFTIGGKIYRQRDGCPIGMDLSVEAASLYMSLWDLKFLKLCKKLGLKIGLYKRYVDDIVICMQGITGGWYFDSKSKIMKFDPGNENVDQNSDARTLLILREIANSIDTAIQFEVDYPSLHENGRLPVLTSTCS